MAINVICFPTCIRKIPKFPMCPEGGPEKDRASHPNCICGWRRSSVWGRKPRCGPISQLSASSSHSRSSQLKGGRTPGGCGSLWLLALSLCLRRMGKLSTPIRSTPIETFAASCEETPSPPAKFDNNKLAMWCSTVWAYDGLLRRAPYEKLVLVRCNKHFVIINEPFWKLTCFHNDTSYEILLNRWFTSLTFLNSSCGM